MTVLLLELMPRLIVSGALRQKHSRSLWHQKLRLLALVSARAMQWEQFSK